MDKREKLRIVIRLYEALDKVENEELKISIARRINRIMEHDYFINSNTNSFEISCNQILFRISFYPSIKDFNSISIKYNDNEITELKDININKVKK